MVKLSHDIITVWIFLVNYYNLFSSIEYPTFAKLNYLPTAMLLKVSTCKKI